MVPREALIRTGTRTSVVLNVGAGRFQPVEVVPGEESGDWVEIRQGIKEGDTVVTSGQFLIDSESSVRASFQRMESAPAADPHAGH
jgi:Cu(I)/Ag(I) efflux system membrane fusion protein